MERLIDYRPQSHQRKFHNDISRTRVIKGGRRSGKTECCIQELIKHAVTTTGGTSWYVAPTYRDANEVGWAKFMAHRDVLQPAIEQINKSEMKVTWRNGHTTYFKGAENEKSLRGRGLTFVILDECAFMKQDIYYQLIRPALMDTRGHCVLITTPNGRNWFYDMFQSSEARYSWTTYDNEIIDDDEIELAKATMSTNDFNQEIMAEFVTQAGMVYHDFSDDNITNKTVPLISIIDIGIGIDFGFANATAIVFMAYNSSTEQVYQFDEIYKERTPIETLSKDIEDKLIRYNIRKDSVKLYTDPAGNAAELSSGISPVDYLRKKGFRVYNKGTEIAPGLALVRRFVKSADDRRSLFIHTRCTETIRSMLGYTYAPNKANDKVIKEEPLKDGIHDHACDAVRYYFVNRFDHGKYVAFKPHTHSYKPQQRATTIMKRCIKCRTTFLSHTPKNKPPYLCPGCTTTDAFVKGDNIDG